MSLPNIDFSTIRDLSGKQDLGFEEFCCQLALNQDAPGGSIPIRLEGAGGDGGVEFFWQLTNGDKWGWQAKYIWELSGKKPQLESSFKTAISNHPELKRYIFCLPFNLTGRTGRKGVSQQELFEGWKTEWEECARKQGVSVAIELWTESTLRDLLVALDNTGGRTAYWFNATLLTNDWFNLRLKEALEVAKPRYSPQLNVDVPIRRSLEAFGRTDEWLADIKNRITRIETEQEHWRHCYSTSDFNGDKDFPDNALDDAKALNTGLEGIKSLMAQSLDSTTQLNAMELVKLIDQAHRTAQSCEGMAKAALIEKHGEHVVDNVPWRQFMAEYQVSFPARHLDTARDVMKLLVELRDWCLGRDKIAVLPYSQVMLLTGPALIGKTHTICDVAESRHARGMLSVVLFGQHFADGDPWSQIIRQLGLPASMSSGAFLSALDEAARVTRLPAIIFIDALNETASSRYWRDRLTLLLSQVKPYQYVRVCISCRSSYLERTLPAGVDLPDVEHTGFAGVEFNALKEFFEHYDLEQPSLPLLQPEFRNPGFLKLLCESLQEKGVSQIPPDAQSFSRLIELFLTEKNKKIAVDLDRNARDREVQRAVTALVRFMAESKSRWLDRSVAKEKIRSELGEKVGESVFEALIKEQLLLEDLRPVSRQSDPVECIAFSFERFADYLLAKELLESNSGTDPKDLFAKRGPLHFLVESVAGIQNNEGILESLAIILPEQKKGELPELVELELRSRELMRIFVSSLVWRSSESITEETQSLAVQALGSSDLSAASLDVLISVSVRPDFELNAMWLHRQFEDMSLIQRDELLCPWAHYRYDSNSNLDSVLRLGLESDLSSLNAEVSLLWADILLWLCASSDRRVRDNATMACVRVVEQHPTIIPELIDAFLDCNDDYIVERLMVVVYGVLLRVHNREAIHNTACLVWSRFFDNEMPFYGVLIRDAAIAIIDLADHCGLMPKDATGQKYWPPFNSQWPVEIPGNDIIEEYKDTFWEIPKLYRSCFSDDFYIYTLSHVDDYSGVSRKDIASWVFSQVLDTGYAQSTVRRFDADLLQKYGHGRAKPEWAERVGKKYQWIMYYRILGILSDNCKADPTSFWLPTTKDAHYYGIGERNIDPTLTQKCGLRARALSWWMQHSYDFAPHVGRSHEEWLTIADPPDTSQMLTIHRAEDKRDFLLLQSYPEWDSRIEKRNRDEPYRQVWSQIRSYLVSKDDFKELWKWIQQKHFMGRWMPEGTDFHDGYPGEYPWGGPFRGLLEESSQVYSHAEVPVDVIPTAHTIFVDPKFDAFHESISMFVPSEAFFKSSGLQWCRGAEFLASDVVAFFDPSLREPGPASLLVDMDFIISFLKERDLCLVWTVLGEKQVILPNLTGPFPGRFEFSQAHCFDGSNLSSGKLIYETKIYDQGED